MDFGVVLQTDPPASEVVRLAAKAETLGFSHGWTFDSHVLWQEPFVIYAQMLAATEQMVVGPMVTNPGTRDVTVLASLFATLNDSRTLGISLYGAEGGRTLAVLTSPQGRSATHLSFGIKPKTGNVWLNICPGTLFLDLCHAAARASIFSGGIDPEYLDRRFDASAEDFARALREGRHQEVE